MKSRSYRDLLVWRKGVELVKKMYALTHKLPKQETFVLSDQIRRATISVPSNIAEGQARKNVGEFEYFLYVAMGSLAELDTQLLLTKELNYINAQTLKDFESDIHELQKMIFALISSLKTRN